MHYQKLNSHKLYCTLQLDILYSFLHLHKVNKSQGLRIFFFFNKQDTTYTTNQIPANYLYKKTIIFIYETIAISIKNL